MQRHGTPRRRSRMQGKGGDMLYERARDLAKQQLANEHNQQQLASQRDTVPYRRVEDQQKAMKQRNDQALNQERKKSEAQIIDQQTTSERRQQLVNKVASQRNNTGNVRSGRSFTARPGDGGVWHDYGNGERVFVRGNHMSNGASPGTGQGGVMQRVRRAKGNPRRMLLDKRSA
jgi:hypothetical protein